MRENTNKILFKYKNAIFLFVLFLVLCSLILTGGFFYYKEQEKQIIKNNEDTLMSVATLKSQEITNWRKERIADANILSEDLLFIDALKTWLNNQGQEELKNKIINRLNITLEHYDYENIGLIDKNGNILLSTGETTIHKSGNETFSLIQESLKNDKIIFSDFYYCSLCKTIHLDLTAPVQAIGGVILLRLNPYKFLYPLIQSYPVPSKTAETLLVKRDGNDVLFLNELRHQKGTALKLRLPVTGKELPASMAVMGKEGIVQGFDYRNIKVLAYINHIPGSPWYMVVKIDFDEIIVPLKSKFNYILHICIALIISAGALIGFYFNRQDKKHYKKQYLMEFELNEKLKLSEEKYKNISEEISDGLVIIIDGTHQWANKAFADIFGYSKEEIIGTKTELLIFPAEVAKVIQRFKNIVEKETFSPRSETIGIKKDGTQIVLEASFKVVTFENKKALQLLVRDITQQKKAEDELKFLAFLLDNATDSIHALDMKGTIIYVNESVIKSTGYSKEELIGNSINILNPPDETDLVPLRIQKIAEQGFARFEATHIRKDGTLFPIEVFARVIEIGGQNFIIAIDRDITERKKTESLLTEEKERLLVTLRSIGDAVITTDINGNIVIMNKIAEQLTGWTLQEAFGKSLSEIFHIINEQTREKCENLVDKIIKSGGICELANHTIIILRDGTERIIADSGAPIFDKDYNIIGIVIVFRDITEKIKTEASLQNMQKLEALGILAGGIAHDFNNLLTGIFGYIEMTKLCINEPQEATEYIDKALSLFERAKGLTQQLLTFAKGGNPIKTLTNITDLLKKTIEFNLTGSNITPLFDIPRHLWSCEIDKNQIGQVIDNIVINAKQAMPSGGQIIIKGENIPVGTKLPLTLHAKNYIKISIQDYGKGIEKKNMPHIFEPFFTTREKDKGSGLGLATAYSIIKKHYGYIDVESEPGKGSTFNIYLPASVELSSIKPDITPKIPKGQGKILIMDDEEFILKIAGKLLKNMGYTVECASKGEEALELYKNAIGQSQPFDLVIFDLTVKGGMGGAETITKLLEIDPDVKAIASSGYSDDPVMETPTNFGFAASLSKPYSINKMTEMINKIIGMRENV